MSPDLGAITLWHLSLDAPPEDAARAVALLDPAERAQHRRFGTAELARAFALRRAARRLILAETLGCPATAVEIETGPRGKPGCAGLAFSTAHSASRAVVAVAPEGPLGVDIERLRSLDLDRLARRVLAPRERALLESLSEDERGAALIRLWTAKEAVVKAEGTGLDLAAFATIEVPALTGDWVPVVAAAAWQVRTWVSDGFAVSVAAPHPTTIDQCDAGALLGA